MTKMDESGLKAGFSNQPDLHQDATPAPQDSKRAGEETGSLSADAPEKQDAEDKSASVDDEAVGDPAGPVITMQGVSGKKITGTVKVVKAHKKARPAQQAPDEHETDSEATPAETAPASVEPATGSPEQKGQPAVAAVMPAETVTPPRRITQERPEAAAETRPVLPEDKPAAATVTPAQTEPAAKAPAPETDRREPAAAAAENPTVAEAAAKAPAAGQPTAKADEPQAAAESRSSGGLGSAPEPRKVGRMDLSQLNRGSQTAGTRRQPDNRVRGAQPDGGAPRGRSDSRSRGAQRPETGRTPAPAAVRPTGRAAEPQAGQPAAKTSAKSREPGPDAPNRGQGPTREARPVNSMRQAPTPGKVGNIFDLQKKDNGVSSSLAATAQAFAQRKQRQAEARDRGPAGSSAAERRGPGAGPSAVPGRRPGPRAYNAGGGGYMDKDKDEDQRPQHARRAPARKKTDAAPELFGRSTPEGRANFSQRDAIDRNKRGSGRAHGRKDAEPRLDRDDEVMRLARRGRLHQQSRRQKPAVAVLTHVTLPEALTVKQFSEAIKKTSAEVIKELMKLGVMATLNEAIDYDTAALVAGEFNISTDKLVEVSDEEMLFDDSKDDPAKLKPRPPVVAVMGHVDHGKTSLLDYIRKTSVVKGEAGGITQHIGAYMVRAGDRKITFLDTPGHEAFTTMRARGAQATDIAILVVAADDGVMPQTIEAIHHAKAANTEIVVAINKIDKPGANVDRVKQELAEQGVIPEDWGGSTIMVPVSAKTGEGVKDLLEMVLLTADILDLKADPDRQAKGIIIEAKLDKNRGPVATMLVQRGTLHLSDTIVAGAIVGNIRAMTDASGNEVKKAGPSVPVEVLGLPEVPDAGELFYAVEDQTLARHLAETRRNKLREDSLGVRQKLSLDNLFTRMSEGEIKELNLIIKADVQGSVEAVTQSLQKLQNAEVKVNVIHGAVGAINESDIRLADVSNAIVIGFNVRPSNAAAEMAKETGVDVRLYRVIYNAIDDIQAALKGMLAPEFKEAVLGHVEIRETFKVSNVGTIGGAYVTDGKVVRNGDIRLVRNGIVVMEGKLASLRRFKDDVKEVAQGFECGISIENFNDIKVGDVIECYEMKEVER
ncbi:MAG: translation initiation factor IF-2 [Oscillospiraceae bacterium]|nr:translation initiation factor IF-2 [Oscillospiraceae bacterium]